MLYILSYSFFDSIAIGFSIRSFVERIEVDESEVKVCHIIPLPSHSISRETVGVLPFVHHGWGKGGLKGKAETSLNSIIQAGSLSAVFDYIVS